MTGLFIILLLVLSMPFLSKQVEENLEVFLFIMGTLAAWMSGVLTSELMQKAVSDPISITVAVLAAGLLAKWLQTPLERTILTLSNALSPRVFAALTVIGLGLVSSVITAIIAAIILVMIVNALPLDRKSQISLTILACYAIGLGAALTPIGEPLATITVSKLDKGFFYLVDLIGPEVICALLLFGLIAFFTTDPGKSKASLPSSQKAESYPGIFIRSFKIYLFVMGLTFLGQGFEPLINEYLLNLRPDYLYWINMLSAVLDNATLAAGEISPSMDNETIRAILLGLLISGGMLVPGNIPNIIAAGKLGITSKEWARFGVPTGLAAMFLYFIILFYL